MPNANIVLILDASGSMAGNYFTAAQTDQATFVYIMRPTDGVGLVGFSDTALVFFPTNGASQLVSITGQPVQDQARSAILGQTTHNMTNMSAAISTAHAMLASAAQPRAMVLLSDGMSNAGPDPLSNLPTDIPIHTIALGPNSDINRLQQIAYRTCGQGQGYHYAPTAWDLADIYNHVVQTTGVSNTVLNAKAAVPNFNFFTQPLPISGGQGEARVAVTWTDPNTVYTAGTPVGAQINVSLRDPNGKPVTPAMTAAGRGFVVMSVAGPMAGNWQVGIWSAQGGGASASLQTSSGGFEPDSATRLSLSFEGGEARTGSAVPFHAAVLHEGRPVPDLHVTAIAEAPLRSFEQALGDHADALAASADADAGDSPLARLAALHAATPDGSILPRETYPVAVAHDPTDGCRGVLTRTGTPGPHTVRLTVRGRSPVDGSGFQRTGRASINLI